MTEELMDLSKSQAPSQLNDGGGHTQAGSNINRRDWLRLTVSGGAGLALGGVLDLSTVKAAAQTLKLANVREFTTSCNFCSCGCGMVAAVREGKLMTMEGDYSFITVTLVADLGLPWHFYQLALQAPAQSAMFEVSWCVGLYVSILLLEFLPVAFERWNLQRASDIWQRWSGAYVAFAVTVFVYLLSRELMYALLAAVVFSTLAWVFRDKRRFSEPILLAIGAVTLSTMHQSSLGSLFLLMPDKLGPQWWSPVMPIDFFLSAIAAGTALIILIEMWIAKAWDRRLRIEQLAALGQITFFSLLVYLVFRLGDLVLRGQLANAFSGGLGALFAVEIFLGGVVPLALLARRSERVRPTLLFAGAFLTAAGVILNRVNVVLLAMNLKGPMPQNAPASYSPTVFEWGVSLGLIAAAVFLFGLGARLMSVLPKAEPGH